MFSLLNKNTIPSDDKNDSNSHTFMLDLNIDQILDSMLIEWDPEIKKMFESFPDSKEDEDYRRDIYCDIKNDDVYSCLMDYHAAIRERNRFAGRMDNAYELIQKQTWYLRMIYTYISSLEMLKDKLSKCSLKSEGLKSLYSYLDSFLSDSSTKSLHDSCFELWNELSDFHVILSYEKGRFTITNGKTGSEYEKFLDELFPGEKHSMTSPFEGTEYFSDLEDEIIKLFQKKNKNYFKKLEKFCKVYSSVSDEQIVLFEKEICYYLAFEGFRRRMELHGYGMCTPLSGGDELSADGLYDLALAISNIERGKETVPNELFLGKDERFFVLTGPNQGGKTTYGRSLGQLIYFTKMGFDVPASNAKVPHYTNLWTHFSVEESIESGRGKLMDELERLKPIMHDSQEGSFVVINELFTTAANFDAIEMGKRVLDTLISKNCKGIYVTHLGELADSKKGVVSLIATVDKENVQTFLIERSAPIETESVNRQVLKYSLTYDRLKERFK